MPIAAKKNTPIAQFHDGATVKGTDKAIPLVSTKYNVRILGGLAVVAVERVFRNIESQSIEATYTFPMPVLAVLNGLTATIDGRTVTAVAQRKQAARETYEDALDRGKAAVLHEEPLKGIHMLSVGHIPAGKDIAVTSTWAMPLTKVGDTVLLRIPTTIGEVYGRSPLPDSDAPVHAAVVHKASIAVASDVGTAHLADGGLIDGRAEVALNAPIEIIVTGWQPRSLEGVAADGRAVTLTITPAPEGEEDISAEVVIDGSGSMDESCEGRHERGRGVPSKHQVLALGLSEIARMLRATDHTRVWQFNNTPRLIGEAWGAQLADRVAALRQPTSGTRTGIALAQAVAGSEARDVIVVSDGKSNDFIQVQQLANSGKRVSVVLVGEDSLEANLGHLAALTGGSVFPVSGSDSAGAVAAALAEARAPHLPLATIDGELSTLTVRRGGMLISATWGAKAEGAASADARTVAAVAAALALPALDEEKAAALAEAHGLVCHLTSLVLVDEAAEAQNGIPAQRQVPLSTPRTADAGGFVSMSLCAAPQASGAMRAMRSADSVTKGFSGAKGLVASSLGSSRGSGGALFSRSRSMFDAGDAPEAVDTSWVERIKESVGRRIKPGLPTPIPGRPDPMLPEKTPVHPLPPVHPTLPTQPVHPATPSLVVDLKWVAGQIDWTADPERLRQGDLTGLRPAVAAAVLRATMLAAVTELALAAGVTAHAVVVALLAKAEADQDRNAGRVFRAILGKTDEAKVAAALRALGL